MATGLKAQMLFTPAANRAYLWRPEAGHSPLNSYTGQKDHHGQALDFV